MGDIFMCLETSFQRLAGVAEERDVADNWDFTCCEMNWMAGFYFLFSLSAQREKIRKLCQAINAV